MLLDALMNPYDHPKNFFLNRPAGTGKTFLYNLVITAAKEKNKKVVLYATTGLAV
jgi:DNA replication protein DnaC